MPDPSINVASLSLSKKALSKLLQSKISAEILAVTGLKKLPDHIRKTIKKAGKKISSELHSGAGDASKSLDTAPAGKSQDGKQPLKEPAKVKAAKKGVKTAQPASPKKAIKIAKPKVANKPAGKAAVARKAVKRAAKKPVVNNGKPAENPVSTAS